VVEGATERLGTRCTASDGALRLAGEEPCGTPVESGEVFLQGGRRYVHHDTEMAPR
jgi:hypothetical protein